MVVRVPTIHKPVLTGVGVREGKVTYVETFLLGEGERGRFDVLDTLP